MQAPMSPDNVDRSAPYYQSAEYAEKLQAAQWIELTRQALMRGESTQATLAYARFLDAVENDATLSHGEFKAMMPCDDAVMRRFPALKFLIEKETKP